MKQGVHTLNRIAEPFRITIQPFRISRAFVQKSSEFWGENFLTLNALQDGLCLRHPEWEAVRHNYFQLKSNAFHAYPLITRTTSISCPEISFLELFGRRKIIRIGIFPGGIP
jgi:hypothetical protein